MSLKPKSRRRRSAPQELCLATAKGERPALAYFLPSGANTGTQDSPLRQGGRAPSLSSPSLTALPSMRRLAQGKPKSAFSVTSPHNGDRSRPLLDVSSRSLSLSSWTLVRAHMVSQITAKLAP